MRASCVRQIADDDYGVPIPGCVLPQEQWARTAIKRLPPPGFLDWRTIFGREAPIVLTGLRQWAVCDFQRVWRGPMTIISASRFCRSSFAMPRGGPISADCRMFGWL